MTTVSRAAQSPNALPVRGEATQGGLCFMETQFPVSKLSKESYTERKAVAGQTLTGLGKWWGRKPLVLCRATILGLLLPATDDPQKDRDVFLRLMTMDDDGMLRRKSNSIPVAELLRHLSLSDRNRFFEDGSGDEKPRWRRGVGRKAKDDLQRRVFLGFSYDERLEYCDRPEEVDGPSPESWRVINDHLGTQATSLPEVVRDLGKRRFGHLPRVGDSFCGGGSIPFEAARLGCEAYGSDLNPVAALLSWAALNIVGGGPEVGAQVQMAQRDVFEAVDRQITQWDIEHREPDQKTGRRWRADAYIYCVEAQCPECGWRVPLAPSWVIAEKTGVIARLAPDAKHRRYDFEVVDGASEKGMKAAAAAGTIKDSEMLCPQCKARTPIRVIRGDGRGSFGESKSRLRAWENQDVIPSDGDIFGERLYCVRWLDTWTDKEGKVRTDRHYRAPTAHDVKREMRALDLLLERFDQWQKKGFIPSRRIEPGYNTDQPIRERGWMYWHHLYNARQLLVHGLFAVEASRHTSTTGVALLLLLGRLANWDSRLCRWQTGQGGGIGGGKDTFSNQALNTLFNYTARGFIGLGSVALTLRTEKKLPNAPHALRVCDGRAASAAADIWVTDPPYADAVNYEEISELFLAWYEGHIPRLFPEWYTDSKRALAVKGSDDFRKTMVDCYRVLADSTPNNGLQVVMFTHQDASVWADLSLILWAAGLRVTAAWCIATETQAGLKEGNYVQGTVLLVLRKQIEREVAFLDEVYPDVEAEVRRQLDSMLALEDALSPNFSDTDYQLAAYAAALRVLTAKRIEEIDVAHELTRTRDRGEVSPVEMVIRNAVRIACDHLVPKGIETHLWKSLSSLERLYLKGIEMESHGEHRSGVYQELARGFGVQEYQFLLASTKANQTRLKTASEFGRKELSGDGFAGTIVRQALFGIFKTRETESPRDAITWFRTEIGDYTLHRQRLIDLLEFISMLRQNASVQHWHKDAEAASVLAGALRNRQDNV